IKMLLSLVMVLVVTACQSTGVVPMENETYMIGKKDSSPGLGVSLNNKAEVYREANDFCSQKGLSVKTININVLPAKFAKLGSTELEFKCIPVTE
ncbi:hypothetical protein, partial [Aliivibrio fischeri]